MDEIEGAFFPVHRTFKTLNGDVTARPDSQSTRGQLLFVDCSQC